MSHIFISYSHRDKEYVHRLQITLQNEGFVAWIDDRIDYGDEWPTVIQEKLDKCDAFIVVMSRNSAKSRMVQNEVTRATSKEKPIFPLLLEGENWLIVQANQYVDVTSGSLPPEKFYDRLEKVTSRIKKTEKDVEKQLIDIRQMLFLWKTIDDLQRLKLNLENILAASPTEDQLVDAKMLLIDINGQISEQKKKRRILEWFAVTSAFACFVIGIGLFSLRDHWLSIISSNSTPTVDNMSTATLPITNTPTITPTPVSEIIITYSDGRSIHRCSGPTTPAILRISERVDLEYSNALTEDDLKKLEWWTLVSDSKEKFGIGETASYRPTGEGGIIYVSLDDIIVCALHFQASIPSPSP